MRKKHITQLDILFLSVSLFVIVTMWIGFNLYHAWVTSTITEDLQVQIIPIAPKFDLVTLDKLKTREKIEPFFELGTISTASPAATPTPIVEEVAEEEEEILDVAPTPIDESDTTLDTEIIEEEPEVTP